MPENEPRKRDKNKSKKQFLNAVGHILKTKGYTALKVNTIAETAGLDKKLIYKYFGGREELIDEYLRTFDFWSNVQMQNEVLNDGGEAFVKEMLVQQYDYMDKNDALQNILLWGISEKKQALKNINDERERNGELLLQNLTDPYFGEKALEFRAFSALLVSGVYYLNMYKGVNGNTFSGIDLTTQEGADQIKNILVKVIDLFYKDFNQNNS
ncbi:TetR/AcrR family transcriptional regulator [Paenimyroides aestuarii]|uniref:TetR/AcrR family transcriptional regulator n=1 Tax=Paenimyroides aestuarii TaxID=2968490 RepID=A0ABY5NTT6_9FLAO|nr:TetR/AcrR family transcriptional regulator [Paenimyroides aestuarii]UUV21998.1 TetR/AcrR family transcriptional regulator [Paenimyroides aestuarii]